MTTTDGSPPTVAVIGCGPGGMFFLHAIETKRRELQQKGDTEGLEALPIATCFDKAPAPGGVWRAERDFKEDEKETAPSQSDEKKVDELAKEQPKVSTPNMYEALWTNGAKENTEFFDYTYDDHFGCRLPVHLPRRAVLDYMLARVTRNAPNLFEDHARFNTNVVSVKYIEDTSKFEVVTRNVLTGKITKGHFDKCIWAAGENGKPKMPKNLVSLFQKGNFQGRIMHSSDARDLKTAVSGKRVLMIGGSYSAEDLTLMAIKLGVDKVYISHRYKYAEVTETSWWPQDKVELVSEQIPVKVTGSSIQFAKVVYDNDEREYKAESEVETEICDIDTVIFCTGYELNVSMLDENLRPPLEPTDLDDCSIPKDWKMTPNEFTPELGDIPVQDVSYYIESSHVQPGLYRGVLMSNPSMMFCFGEEGEEPLFETDIIAWKLLAYITGTTPLPSQQEMQRRNNLQFQREFQIPYFRWVYDVNYRNALEALGNDHWKNDAEDERYKSVEYKQYIYPWLVTSIDAKDGHYPVDIGSHDDDTLTEIGKKYYELHCKSGWLRTLPDAEDDEYEWRTFRDYEAHHAECFSSVFTGTKAVPLKKRWMDIDEEKDVLW